MTKFWSFLKTALQDTITYYADDGDRGIFISLSYVSNATHLKFRLATNNLQINNAHKGL